MDGRRVFRGFCIARWQNDHGRLLMPCIGLELGHGGFHLFLVQSFVITGNKDTGTGNENLSKRKNNAIRLRIFVSPQ